MRGENVFGCSQRVAKYGYEVCDGYINSDLYFDEEWELDRDEPSALRYIGEGRPWKHHWEYRGPYIAPKMPSHDWDLNDVKFVASRYEEATTSLPGETNFEIIRHLKDILDVQENPFPVISCDPMMSKGLLAEFVKTKSTDHSILQFANKYGTLSRAVRILSPCDHRPQRHGESIRFWWCHLEKVAKLHHLHNLLTDWAPEREILAWLLHDKGLNAYYTVSSHCGAETREFRAKIRQSAKEFLVSEVNEELMVRCAPRISSHHNSFTVKPNDLLGAIYAHFAISIAEMGRDPRKCEFCAAWFAPNDEREKYCSSSCRYKAYRKRKNNLKKTPLAT